MPCADLPGVMLVCVLSSAKSNRTKRASWWGCLCAEMLIASVSYTC